jgi:hypothetical protein
VTEPDAGFSIVHDVFLREEMVRVLGAIEQSGLARTKAGARHLLEVGEVRRLATDPRLVDIAGRWLGPRAFPYRATLFDKSLESNWLVTWHQDTALPVVTRRDNPKWGPWTMKGGRLHAIAPASALEAIVALRVHLDDSTSANGPLRVLPGTHARGILDHAAIQELAGAIAPVECVTNTGGVVSMRPLTVHASSKARNDRPRRVVHIEYAADVRLDADIELAVG